MTEFNCQQLSSYCVYVCIYPSAMSVIRHAASAGDTGWSASVWFFPHVTDFQLTEKFSSGWKPLHFPPSLSAVFFSLFCRFPLLFSIFPFLPFPEAGASGRPWYCWCICENNNNMTWTLTNKICVSVYSAARFHLHRYKKPACHRKQ